MSSFLYLTLHKAKNTLREMLRKPFMLVCIVLLVGLCVASILTAEDVPMSELRSIDELYAIILAYFSVNFFLIAKSGFSNGASMFSMADINLIFTSPKKARTVLNYGLFSQLGRSLFGGFFILYQYAWLHDLYGVTFSTIVIVLVGYAFILFLAKMLAMIIYSLTCFDEKRHKLFQAVFYTLSIAFLAFVAFKSFNGSGFSIERAVIAANSLPLKFVPVAGFVQYGVVSAITGDFVGIAIALGCVVLCVALFILAVSKLNTDYYEDVLKATEVSFSAITARKEGKVQETAPQNVKVGKTGFVKGEGASAIFEKHKIENRRSKIFMMNKASLAFAAISIALTFFIKEATFILAMNVYFTIFSVGLNRWSKELQMPYVYMIPEPPFKKMLYTLKEQLPSHIAEAVITFVPVSYLLKLSPLECVGLVLAKLSFTFLLVAVDLFMDRFIPFYSNRGLQVLVYFAFVFIFAIPGIAAYAMCSFFSYGNALVYSLGIYFMAAVNLLISFILLFLSRNILQYAENTNN